MITISPDNGNESLVLTLSDVAGFEINDIVYLAASNEVIGFGDQGMKLLKINVTTKQTTSLVLTTNMSIDHTSLVVDNNNNLYAVKRDWTNPNQYIQSLVKIDPATGSSSVIKTFQHDNSWRKLVYLPANNSIAGLIDDGTRLFKINLTTKDTSSVLLAGSSDIDYRELVTDDQSNLYAYKGNYSDPDNYIGQLVKLNAATGQETLLTTLTEYGKIHHNLVYVPERNEITSIWDEVSLFRFNVNTKASSTLPLTSQQDIVYGDMTSN